jgi:magnesium transporter
MNKTFIFEKKSVRAGVLDDLKYTEMVWSDIESPSEKELDLVSKYIGTSPEEVAVMLKRTQRPVIFNLDKYSGVIFSMPVADKEIVGTAPVVFFISRAMNNLVAIHKKPCSAIKKLHTYSEAHNLAVFKSGATTLLMTILEEITDNFFITLDELSDQIEEVEQKMFDYRHSSLVMKKTFGIKKSLIYIHKALVANRDVVMAIEKQYAEFLDIKKVEKFHGINADITQLIEMTTTYRDIVTSAIEIHLSSISNNLNITMKKVTSWGALILVPSLIAGIFGMNFKHIPLLDSPTGFFISLIVMVVSVVVLAFYSRKKDWL